MAACRNAVTIECVVPSCSVRVLSCPKQAAADGWGVLRDSLHFPPKGQVRQFIGWCPACAKRFRVGQV